MWNQRREARGRRRKLAAAVADDLMIRFVQLSGERANITLTIILFSDSLSRRAVARDSLGSELGCKQVASRYYNMARHRRECDNDDNNNIDSAAVAIMMMVASCSRARPVITRRAIFFLAKATRQCAARPR